jgi:hypothetical protein
MVPPRTARDFPGAAWPVDDWRGIFGRSRSVQSAGQTIDGVASLRQAVRRRRVRPACRRMSLPGAGCRLPARSARINSNPAAAILHKQSGQFLSNRTFANGISGRLQRPACRWERTVTHTQHLRQICRSEAVWSPIWASCVAVIELRDRYLEQGGWNEENSTFDLGADRGFFSCPNRRFVDLVGRGR